MRNSNTINKAINLSLFGIYYILRIRYYAKDTYYRDADKDNSHYRSLEVEIYKFKVTFSRNKGRYMKVRGQYDYNTFGTIHISL